VPLFASAHLTQAIRRQWLPHSLGDGKPEWPAGSIVMRKQEPTHSLSLNAWHTVSTRPTAAILLSGSMVSRPQNHRRRSKSRLHPLRKHTWRKARPAQHLSEAAEHEHSLQWTDLSGWKSIPYAPKASNGVGHSLAKVFGGATPSRTLPTGQYAMAPSTAKAAPALLRPTTPTTISFSNSRVELRSRRRRRKMPSLRST